MKKVRPTTLLQWIGWRPWPALLTYERTTLKPLVKAEGFDYYTGVSFEIHVPELGPRKVIASGGRYDNLVESLGAPHQIPAVGGAIALERLHEAAGR